MRVIEDSPGGWRGGGGGGGGGGCCFRFVRREEEKEGRVRHCSGSLNAKNREFKRVSVRKERTVGTKERAAERCEAGMMKIGCWKVDRGLISCLNAGMKLN